MDSTIVSLDEIEAIAEKCVPKNALDYFKSGAEKMITLHDNSNAFKK